VNESHPHCIMCVYCLFSQYSSSSASHSRLPLRPRRHVQKAMSFAEEQAAELARHKR
jgi:hypothetical protein